ncbi:MAG: DNA translocase FtsK, partial [Clostridia bacterium]|nr:DNA translocase FtsK [Clostridia bacterium]
RNDPAQTDKTRQNVIRVRKQRKYVFPPLDLLKPADGERDSVVDNDDIYALEAERNAEKLKATLRNFGIGVWITGITRGPTVTRFEFKPDEGIKISRIVALTDDIALSLAASAVRMEAPIPGKPAIGIEIPNKTPSTVYIHDVLDSNEYKTAKSKLSVAIGKDIDGKTVITDLAKMPHLLIAGSTGSGKSVCINTMIMGILYGAAPDEVKFIMIDPKVVELGIYNNIPHLLIPVVTEPKKASAALAWAVSEVERRYRLFAENNVRDLANFNRCVKEKPEMAHLEKLPQIVIIIDELADLMMASPQDVERSIIRLAQKARAAGVHLVIATQRPSVDVITGIIKANIPSRIAFAVASQFDSRTILDTNGAEKLLGRGDMLYHPLGFTKSARLQCAFVSDEEVEKVVDFIRNSYGAPEFDDTVSDAITATVEQSQKEKGGKGGGDKEQDNQEESEGQEFKLICDAAELALAQGTLSTSSLQRRLRLGYSRAARIIDTLEEMGLLSRSDGQRPRQVLMTREQWKKGIEEMKADE